MKRYSIFFMLPACASMAWAQPNHCTPDTIVGTYAVAAQGTMMMSVSGASQAMPVPYAGLCVASIDSQGAVSCSGYMSAGGQVTKSPMPGTIKISSDCTGTVDWGGGVTGALVVLGEGQEINSMGLAGGPMGSPIVIGRWKRISRTPNTIQANQCSPNDLVGVYAIRQGGTLMVTQPGGTQAVPMPVEMVATGSVGYDGAGPANGTASVGGQTLQFGIPSATFTRNADCTITTAFDLALQGVTMGQAAGWGVVLDGGGEVWTIETQDPAGLPIILGTWKRISPMPADK